MKKPFYVDSCIYLNLWQREGNEKFGAPYWKIAQDFFEKCSSVNRTVYYSRFVLKELEFILTAQDFKKKMPLFGCLPFKRVNASAKDIRMAREIESELKYEISFYDIIHIILAMKTGSILVTRDRRLLESAVRYSVMAKKPESLLF